MSTRLVFVRDGDGDLRILLSGDDSVMLTEADDEGTEATCCCSCDGFPACLVHRETENFSSTQEVDWPDGVESCDVYVFGAGGDGEDTAAENDGGGGGGGGGSARAMDIAKTVATLDVTIDGSVSEIEQDGSTLASATVGGDATGATGGTGGTGTTGDFTYSGGDGADGVNGSYGGGGGGGAGTKQAGLMGIQDDGGKGGVRTGGDGGDGGTADEEAEAGENVGGGGGGAYGEGGNGGAGGSGRVRIDWHYPREMQLALTGITDGDGNFIKNCDPCYDPELAPIWEEITHDFEELNRAYQMFNDVAIGEDRSLFYWPDKESYEEATVGDLETAVEQWGVSIATYIAGPCDGTGWPGVPATNTDSTVEAELFAVAMTVSLRCVDVFEGQDFMDISSEFPAFVLAFKVRTRAPGGGAWGAYTYEPWTGGTGYQAIALPGMCEPTVRHPVVPCTNQTMISDLVWDNSPMHSPCVYPDGDPCADPGSEGQMIASL